MGIMRDIFRPPYKTGAAFRPPLHFQMGCLFFIRTCRVTFLPRSFREGKDRPLDYPREIYAVVECQVKALHTLLGPAVSSCIFFRPEEHRFSSERIDDAGLIEFYCVDHRDEYPHSPLLVGDPVSQVAVDGNLDGVSAILALGPDDKRERPF
jgi:hypothetical protein